MRSTTASSVFCGWGAFRAPQRRHRSFLALVAFLCSFAMSACVSMPRYATVTDVPDELQSNADLNRQLAVMAAQASSGVEYRIGPEDLIEVTLFDLQDNQGEPRIVDARVSASGYVTLPYVGKVPAAGFTPTEFENALRDAYKRYIHEPQLTVLIREYRSYRVSVLGYVNEPGVLELKGRKTLLEAIAMAGGLTDEAGNDIRITRAAAHDGPQTVLIDLDRIANEGDLALNLDLLPGDVVTVPKAGTFYVEGVVKKPGAYPLLQEMTVSQAVATAGGADKTVAKISATTLYRKTEDGARVAIPINLAALERGNVEDIPIQEDDVIVVPMSLPKMWIDRITRGVLRVGFNAPLPL